MNSMEMLNALMADSTKKAKRLKDKIIVNLSSGELIGENSYYNPISFFLSDEWEVFTYCTKTKLPDFYAALTYINSGKEVEYYFNGKLYGVYSGGYSSFSTNQIENGEWYLVTYNQ